MNEETIVTDPTTGGAKGSKLERFDLLPVGPLRAVARHYGKGAEKYEDRNWERGYAWSLSYAAMQRHANAFWGGEDTDEETGSPHLAAVVFHALAMLEWATTHPEMDDRPLGATYEQSLEYDSNDLADDLEWALRNSTSRPERLEDLDVVTDDTLPRDQIYIMNRDWMKTEPANVDYGFDVEATGDVIDDQIEWEALRNTTHPIVRGVVGDNGETALARETAECAADEEETANRRLESWRAGMRRDYPLDETPPAAEGWWRSSTEPCDPLTVEAFTRAFAKLEDGASLCDETWTPPGSKFAIGDKVRVLVTGPWAYRLQVGTVVYVSGSHHVEKVEVELVDGSRVFMDERDLMASTHPEEAELSEATLKRVDL